MTSQSANVQVLVRCRPPLETEQGIPCEQIECDEQENVVRVQATASTDRCFDFNKVLGARATQDDVFEYASPLIDHALDGLHATIFAYGQTGSGKTHTMEGFEYQGGSLGEDAKLRPVLNTAKQKHGVIPRTVAAVFDRAQSRMDGSDRVRYKIKVSYFQIYNERVFDLLNPTWKKPGRAGDQSSQGLRIRWGKGNTFYVENLFLYECDSANQARDLFQAGVKNKAMGSHHMNLQSSRSHSLFTLYIESWDPQQPECIIKSELTLVDLAGSEKLTLMSKNPSAKLLQESIEINASLLALGKVISALGSGSAKSQHVPYRDSKLTKLLKHSLGGNSLTLMIACINPCDAYVDESVSTLFYAGRARNIRNDPRVNEDSKSALIRALRAEILSLKTELQHYRALAMDGGGHRGPSPSGEDGRPRTAPDGDSREAEYLGEKLVDSVKMLKDIIIVNGQLRDAFDRLTELRAEAEASCATLNEENVQLRERIEMLESIVMQEDDDEDEGGGGGGGGQRKRSPVKRRPSNGGAADTARSADAATTAAAQARHHSGVLRGAGRKALERYNRRYRHPRVPAYEDYYGSAPQRERRARSSSRDAAAASRPAPQQQPRAFEGLRFKQQQPLFARPAQSAAAAPPPVAAGTRGLQAAAAAAAQAAGGAWGGAVPGGVSGSADSALGEDFESRRRARAARAAQLEQQHRMLQQRRFGAPAPVGAAPPAGPFPPVAPRASQPLAAPSAFSTPAPTFAASPWAGAAPAAPPPVAAPQPPAAPQRGSFDAGARPPAQQETPPGIQHQDEMRKHFSAEQLAIIARRRHNERTSNLQEQIYGQTRTPNTGPRFGL
eukprot:TRINITY_DN1592_c0_g1_i1.p1 TRINITY_DN1592_c0_g1~~TRINITY_DN1592_c0_g1_i1.p1  ORF type:complete len:863 (+),score=301.82 TRINITY_DN1592_c0_g1_i1:76-2589(+)